MPENFFHRPGGACTPGYAYVLSPVGHVVVFGVVVVVVVVVVGSVTYYSDYRSTIRGFNNPRVR